MSVVWRLLRDEPAGTDLSTGPALQMARDEVLLESVCAGGSPALRFYQWQGPAVTLGRFQRIDRGFNKEKCDQLGIPVTRRINGGRAILHGDDLTIGMAFPVALIGLSHQESIKMQAIYSRLAGIFSAALEQAGMVAEQGNGSVERLKQPSHSPDCFASTTIADLTMRATGQKVLGTALHRRGEAILLQASLPLHTQTQREYWNNLRQQLFGGAPAPDIARELNRTEVESAIVQNITQQLNSECCPSLWSEQEQSSADLLQKQRYSCPEWISNPVSSHVF